VIFSDPNGKEVARAKHITNDYGSFSGSFTAPSGKGTGRMTIRCEAQPFGQTQVNVEEYKRPKFQVTVAKPKEGGKLNGPVPVEGTVKVYRLKAPETVQRAPLRDRYYHPMPVMHRGREKEPEPDMSNPNSWPLGDAAAERKFKTDKDGKAKLDFQLGVGVYRV